MPPLYMNRVQYDTIQVDADAIARQMGFDGVAVIENEETEDVPGWGEAKGSGSVGTTQQIEDAHRKLDEIGIMPGPLASRAEKAARLIGQYMSEDLRRSERTQREGFVVDL